MDGIIIRKATFLDSAEIANVHINSWREAYAGLIHSDFLNDRPLHFKNRYALWRKVTVNEKQSTFVAESLEHGVIGFINGSHARDEAYKGFTEVWSFYLLEKYHGKKIGFRLLQKFFNKQIELGFQKAYLWVLKDNPSISFYEATGGVFNGEMLDEQVGTQMLPHLCYTWNRLKF